MVHAGRKGTGQMADPASAERSRSARLRRVRPAARLSIRTARALDRVQARLARLARPATAFVSTPEPRSSGVPARGRQIVAGSVQMRGHLLEHGEATLWALALPDAAVEAAAHGFTWLDDLAALGDAPARARAQDWLFDWIARYGRGAGPGWSAQLAGQRLIRLINNAVFVLQGLDRARSMAYFATLSHQARFVHRRWRSAPAGLARFEALTGLIYAGVALEGMDGLAEPAAEALARECALVIDEQGGLPGRNPEELLEVFTLLIWAAGTLGAAGKLPPPAHLAAIERVAPTLRALRHGDGGLARFHGGSAGRPGQLDEVLASSGVRGAPVSGLAMGFARLAFGRTSVVVDAAAPPSGEEALAAHASTCAFEMTSGRRPVIVSFGPGTHYGPDWSRAARATPSHSTLGITGLSSARFSERITSSGTTALVLDDPPRDVRAESYALEEAVGVLVSHDGYRPSHGLTHVRRLELAPEGALLRGEDTLAALSNHDRQRFDLAMDDTGLQGVGFAIRFHLHPDVEPRVDLGGTAVSLSLPSGELWVLRHDGVADLTLEPGVFFDTGRLHPRATKQVVLSSRVIDYGRQVCWTLARAQDPGGHHIRDLVRDEGPVVT